MFRDSNGVAAKKEATSIEVVLVVKKRKILLV